MKIYCYLIFYIKFHFYKYIPGIPTSLRNTGEQWDWYNCWAPLQGATIFGLINSKSARAEYVAFNLADSWVYTNYVGFQKTGFIYEKVSRRFYFIDK